MISIEVANEAVAEALAALVARAENLEPGLEAVGQALVARVLEGFDAGVSPAGDAWDPLKLRSGQPLLDTGRLRSSIHSQVLDGENVAVGTNVLYGVVHQFGAEIKAQPGIPGENFIGRRYGAPRLHWQIGGQHFWAKEVIIPARPFLPWDAWPEDWSADVLDAISAYIVDDDT